MAAVPPDGEENSEPLKYKTWVLKVSIHCEGCKRKVKRILHNVEGVYTINVDTKQHKVVVTGNVDANILLRKLEKSGKHAEMWPDLYRKPNKNNSQNEQQQPPPPPNEEDPSQNQTQKDNPEKVAVNEEHHHQQQLPHQIAENNPGQQPLQQQGVKEVRFEGDAPPPGSEAGSGAAKKKKKKKKSNGGGGGNTPNDNGNGNNNGAVNNNEVKEQHPPQQQGGNGGPPCSESPPPPHQQGMGQGPYPNQNQGNMSPPRHMPNHNRVYEYPPAYHASPPPVYDVSYNTAYPRSYAASYYSAPPPYLYAYVHQGGDVEMPLPSDLSGTSVQPPDTFELFSDENPNACSVM